MFYDCLHPLQNCSRYFINHNTKSTQWEDPRLAGIPTPPYHVAVTQPTAYFEVQNNFPICSRIYFSQKFSWHKAPVILFPRHQFKLVGKGATKSSLMWVCVLCERIIYQESHKTHGVSCKTERTPCGAFLCTETHAGMHNMYMFISVHWNVYICTRASSTLEGTEKVTTKTVSVECLGFRWL